MGVFDTVSDLFGSDGQQYRFRCRDCHAEFAQLAVDATALSCPQCGSERVQSDAAS